MQRIIKVNNMPRLPLEGNIDLTYRCNNNCRHCWLWTPDWEAVQKDELTFEKICGIVDEARAMGCQYWRISGGEPLLRHDFQEIFEYLTDKATGYTLNTNGTLITPDIARLLKRKGTKLIALYGATADVYDFVTNHSGGFEKLMQGFAYLKEAGAGFIVQVIPMQANLHQWDQMLALAESLSPVWRVGAPWLYLSKDGSLDRNREILAQRLLPEQVVVVDKPNPANNKTKAKTQIEHKNETCCAKICHDEEYLFARCIKERRDFHIDPYGQMTWCAFVVDPALRYDLRNGSFQEAWESFIPSCAGKVRGGEEWRRHCGSCVKRDDCRWCAVYAYLETGRYSAPIPYLCKMADEVSKFKQQWEEKHRRYFQVAGITVSIESEINLEKIKFKDELNAFAVNGPGEDIVTLCHHFELPEIKDIDLGKEIYRKPPWIISYKDKAWIYQVVINKGKKDKVSRLAVFNDDYTRGIIYNTKRVRDNIIKYEWHSLSLFPTDQIWLIPLLANRSAIILHSAAAIVNGKGLVFVGHSDAGKSTTMELLKTARTNSGIQAEILCDDRNIIRKWTDGWRVYGTWSHGDTRDVSQSCASLKGIIFLEQDKTNCIDRYTDRKNIWRMLLATLIKSTVTAQWWQKELDVIEQLINEVPFYKMRFDKTGAIIPELEKLTQ